MTQRRSPRQRPLRIGPDERGECFVCSGDRVSHCGPPPLFEVPGAQELPAGGSRIVPAPLAEQSLATEEPDFGFGALIRQGFGRLRAELLLADPSAALPLAERWRLLTEGPAAARPRPRTLLVLTLSAQDPAAAADCLAPFEASLLGGTDPLSRIALQGAGAMAFAEALGALAIAEPESLAGRSGALANTGVRCVPSDAGALAHFSAAFGRPADLLATGEGALADAGIRDDAGGLTHLVIAGRLHGPLPAASAG